MATMMEKMQAMEERVSAMESQNLGGRVGDIENKMQSYEDLNKSVEDRLDDMNTSFEKI